MPLLAQQILVVVVVVGAVIVLFRYGGRKKPAEIPTWHPEAPRSPEYSFRRMLRTMTIQEREVLKEMIAVRYHPDLMVGLQARVGEDLFRRVSDRFDGARQHLGIPEGEFIAAARKVLKAPQD